MHLLTITCLHNKAAAVRKRLVKSICLGVRFDNYGISNDNYVDWQQLTCDVIKFLAPFLQAYQHQFTSLSPFCKRFEDES